MTNYKVHKFQEEEQLFLAKCFTIYTKLMHM